jgi:2,3-dihydro-2,3-dihydroxybenzoate dehydrogenase
MGLNGRLALITGAAQGIGAAVAHELARRGARIAAADADAERVRVLAAELVANGHDATGHTVDVRDGAAVRALVRHVEDTRGPVDILVNVAGVLRTGELLDLSDEDWSAMLDVNTTGVLTVSRAVARQMVPRRSGAIVTVASNAGFVPRAGMGGYSASKAASAMLTKCLGLELARHGIRCNVVSPGSTDTSMLRSLWTDDDAPRATLEGSPAAFRVGIPLRKLARPEDIADAVAFLVSDEAGHITMHDLCVDGGASLGG